MYRKKDTKNTEIIPLIFPIYIDVNRVKDIIAILEDGFHSSSSITEEGANEVGKATEVSGNVGINFLSLIGKHTKEKTESNRNNKSYEKQQTNASLFNKILKEFKNSGRIKEIVSRESLSEIKEGDIVQCEGSILGNENEAFFNKFSLLIDTMSKLGVKETKEIKEQLTSLKEILETDDRISDSSNTILKLCDNTELLVTIHNKNLVDETGVELVRGKYKVLGVVFEKIIDGDSINIMRDSLASLFNSDDLNKMVESMNTGLEKANLCVPKLKTAITGPSIGIMPIGIYL